MSIIMFVIDVLFAVEQNSAAIVAAVVVAAIVAFVAVRIARFNAWKQAWEAERAAADAAAEAAAAAAEAEAKAAAEEAAREFHAQAKAAFDPFASWEARKAREERVKAVKLSLHWAEFEVAASLPQYGKAYRVQDLEALDARRKAWEAEVRVLRATLRDLGE